MGGVYQGASQGHKHTHIHTRTHAHDASRSDQGFRPGGRSQSRALQPWRRSSARASAPRGGVAAWRALLDNCTHVLRAQCGIHHVQGHQGDRAAVPRFSRGNVLRLSAPGRCRQH
eukprot:1251913-Pleurochrysis_carterae.AAC.1